MGILNKIKELLTGGSQSSSVKKIREANRTTNYGGGVSTTDTASFKRAYIKKKREEEEKTREVAKAFRATTPKAQKTVEEKAEKVKKSDVFNRANAFKASNKATTPTIKHKSTALGTLSEKEVKSYTAKRNAAEANRKEQSRTADRLKPLIDAKYGGTTAESKRRIKSGEYMSDPDVAKYEYLKHPVASSLARGGLSGATFGLSELAAAKLPKSKGMQEAERTYQANKSKGAEFAGEMAGSLASFGLTGGLSKEALAKVAPKTTARLGESATKLLSKNKLVVNAARNEAIRKIGISATEDEIAKFAAARAAKLVSALGEDAAINLTTGAVSDVAHAIIDSDDPAEFAKNMAISAGVNLALGGVTSAIPAIRGRSNAVDDVAEVIGRNIDDTRGIVEFPPRETGIDVINPDLERPRGTVEIGRPEEGIDVINPDLERPRTVEIGRRDEGIDIINPDAEKAKPRVKEREAKAELPPKEDVKVEAPAPKEKPKAEVGGGGKQMTLDDAMRAAEERKAKPEAEAPKNEQAKKPKSKKQKKIDEQKERRAIDDVMRKREENLASEMRAQTGGEYSYRQGEHTAAEHSSVNEARRITDEQEKVYKQLKDDNVKELFTDENTPFGIFKTANKAELKKKAAEATTRVREDTYGAVRRLREKAERLEAELTKNSALSSAEHITLDDIADITAIRNIYEEAGMALPAEYEKAFSHVIEWQRTEAAQMLKSVDIFLKENDREYRRMFIARDVDRYLRKVLNADNAAIADIKRSLDTNNGKGYFDKMVEALAEFKGSENEAAFRKAYADFQAEIFMNTKPTVWDTVNLWRHAFMLSSPKTGANNIIGNLMQRAMYNISDAMNAVGENAARSINKDAKRTTAFLKTKDQRRLANMFTNGRLGERNVKNAKYLTGFDDQAFADAINRAADVDVADMMDSSKYMGDVIKGLKYKPTTAAGEVKQGFVKAGSFGNEYVSIMLNEPDSWFVERNYRSALLKYLEANGVNSAESLAGNGKILKEARAYAKDVALENTYKKANNVVSFLEGLRRKGHTKGSNAGYKAAAIMLDAELPYLKVPANLIVNNFKYSPLGLGKGAVDAFRGAVKGDAELLNKATRELSKGLTGTGMAALGYMMFCKDQADTDSWGFIGNAEDALKEYGVRDNSFKIGDHNFNIANMGIGSVQFLMGASLAEDLAKEGVVPPHQVALDSISKTVDTVADMSLMENAVSLLDAFGNGGDYNATVSDRLGNAATEIAGDYAAQFVPNPLRGVAKGLTDADLDTGVKKGDTTKVQRVLQRNANNFVQGLPGLNEKILPHKVDSHGNLVGEKKTRGEKIEAVLNNTLNPLSPKKVNIPEADKVELSVKDENGNPFKPKGFDSKREYKSGIGQGERKETIKLTGKEREQVARAAKKSGRDMAEAIVKKGMFGDRLGDRAQSILKDIPDDEEKARELIFSTAEWKNLSNEDKNKYLNIMYGQGGSNNNRMGVERTRKAEAYINIAGNSEGDFRYQNDLNWQYQKKYEDNHFADLGIDKGTWADAIQSIYDSSHKWDEEKQKNIDTPNSARKVKAGILAVKGLTPEQRVAMYQAIRGKRNGFGWYDWDGVSNSGGYYRRGRGYRRFHRRGGGGKGKAVAHDSSAFKAKKNHVAVKKVATPKSNVSVKTTGKISTGAAAGRIPTVKSSAKVSPPKSVKRSASRVNTSPTMSVTPFNFKTVKPKSASKKDTKLAAALKDIEKTQKKVAPPKARSSK